MSVAKTIWTITPHAFDSLLYALDPDRDRAGRMYENMRRRLLEFFEARGSFVPEEHADETLDRVMRRMAEGEKIENPAGYCYGVAKFVWMEASRKLARQPLQLDENAVFPTADNDTDSIESARDAVEDRLNCFEQCLDHLTERTRDFIIEYYREENGVKIEQRRLLAEKLNTTINALRLRASRLRRELVKCTNVCLDGKQRDGLFSRGDQWK
jgi:DNA-directed RNA polymerase specialized sigma24 family protein